MRGKFKVGEDRSNVERHDYNSQAFYISQFAITAMSTTGLGSSSRRVDIGIIGCGEVTQVIHAPTLILLSHLFRIRYVCDVSPGALALVSSKIPHEHVATADPAEVCASPDVEVVFILNSDEYHCAHAVMALGHGKHAFIEKPMALCIRDADRIIEAERRSGKKVMVGYMRRYAAAFADALAEIGGAGEILYARVRGVIGFSQKHPFGADIEGGGWEISLLQTRFLLASQEHSHRASRMPRKQQSRIKSHRRRRRYTKR